MSGDQAIDTEQDRFDLDFTRVGGLRAVPPPPAAAPTAAAPEPATGGGIAPGCGKLVCYARASGSAAVTEAPVLVVEDHDGSRRLLEKMLLLLGHKVRSARDNREMARELRQPPLPKMILLDINLPRVDGYSILAHLRAHPQTSAIPVALVTARADQKDVIRGLSLGAEGYLSKPVSVNGLRSLMDTVLWKQ